MNIFYLDEDMYKNAEYYVDSHVVKQILEHTQMLCSTYYYTDNIPNNIYKIAHKNHPCTVWTRESLSNWIWLRDFTLILYDEYQYRFNNKTHKSGELVKTLPIPNIKDLGVTRRPQAMPITYKNDKDTVKAYRCYYFADKQHLLKYTKRSIPLWIQNPELIFN